MKNKKNIIKLFGLLLIVVASISCKKEETANPELTSEFKNEQKITITGYTSDAMEPLAKI